MHWLIITLLRKERKWKLQYSIFNLYNLMFVNEQRDLLYCFHIPRKCQGSSVNEVLERTRAPNGSISILGAIIRRYAKIYTIRDNCYARYTHFLIRISQYTSICISVQYYSDKLIIISNHSYWSMMPPSNLSKHITLFILGYDWIWKWILSDFNISS